MLLFLTMCTFCVSTLAQDGTNTLSGLSTPTTTGVTLPIGADYLPMEGGTKLEVPFPEAVPIVQDGLLSGGDPEFPCFGTFSGCSAKEKLMLITSFVCRVKGIILLNYTDHPDYGNDIQLTKVIPNNRSITGGQLISATYPFEIIVYSFSYQDRLNPSVFTGGELIKSKSEYHGIVRDVDARGIVLASQPYKAGAVSLNQTMCPYWYTRRAHQNSPDVIPEGVFCVFIGTESIPNPYGNGVPNIEPGLPCRDSVGSPVLVRRPSGSYKVLGIVVDHFCEWTPPDWGFPKLAIATSTAYGLDRVTAPSTIPLPPEETFSWATFRTKQRRETPFGASPQLTLNRALVLSVAIERVFRGTTELF